MTQSQAGLQCHVQILGPGSVEATPCCVVVTDKDRYLFNVGEGAQRLCMEHRVKAAKVDHIFLSHLHAESLGGLPGMMLTLADVGKKSLTIHGPIGLRQFFYATRHFMRRDSMFVTIREYGTSTEAVSGDHCMVHAVVINPVDTPPPSPPPPTIDNSSTGGTNTNSDDASTVPHKRPRLSQSDKVGGGHGAITYIFRTAEIQGKFLVEKAKELGIPAGPVYGRLKAGESVTLPDGRTIDPSQVVGPSIPGSMMAVVACPSPAYLPNLLKCQELNKYASSQSSDKDHLSLLIHFTPYSIATTDEYRQWIASFGPEVKHIMASYPSDHHRSPYRCARLHSLRLNLIEPRVFPRPVCHSPDLPPTSSTTSNVIAADCLMKYIIAPRTKQGLDNSMVLADIGPEDQAMAQTEVEEKGVLDLLQELRCKRESEVAGAAAASVDGSLPPFTEKEEVFIPHDSTVPERSVLTKGDAEVIFLGTGSAIPSKFRNVTGIYVRLREDGRGMLLDVGEGSYSQLATLLPKSRVSELLLGLRVIWISHPHADHHLGIMRILAERAKLAVSPQQLDPLMILGPKPVLNWLREYQALDPTVDWGGEGNLVELDRMTPSAKSYLREHLGITSLVNIPVRHCAFAYAVVLDSEDGWRMVYSGDTRPSDKLIEAGQGATVLIHEATFEVGKQQEALEKKHCTVVEALDVARAMKAKHVILTHFSQRYPHFPVLPEQDTLGVVIAFDLMKVRFSDLPRVAGLLPVFSKLFPPEEEDKSEDEEEVAMAIDGKEEGASGSSSRNAGGRGGKAKGKAPKEPKGKQKKNAPPPSQQTVDPPPSSKSS